MSNDLIQKNAELGRFLFCERYTLQPVKNALYIAEGQDLKRGAVVDVNGVLVGTNSLMPYAVLENDCDTRAKGTFASVFVKGEFNIDKLFFADGLSKNDLDNIVYNGSGIGLVIKPYNYSSGFVPKSEIILKNIEFQIWKDAKIETDTLRFVFEKFGFDPNVLNISNIKWTKKDSALLNVWEAKYLNNAASLLSGKFRYTGSSSIDNFNQTGWVDIVAGNINKSFFNGLSTNESFRSIEIREGSFGGTMYSAFSSCDHLKSLILPTSGIEATTIGRMADGCDELEYVNNFDTSKVTDASLAFNNCYNLKKVPLLDTGKMANVTLMFSYCYNVEEGALALYTRMSSQATPPSSYSDTFYKCGENTTTGAAELAQIPTSWGGTYDPYNPLGLPSHTIRVKFSSGYTPSMGDSQTLVDADKNVWDIYKNSDSWNNLFEDNGNVIAVLGANTNGVNNMNAMFFYCNSLGTVQLFDTSKVTDMRAMFNNCISLTSIPLFNTSKALDVRRMFNNCTLVESGALALYQQASTQANVPYNHSEMFSNCGSYTETGVAELAQIPQSWGGTAAG